MDKVRLGDVLDIPMGREGYPCADVYSGTKKFSAPSGVVKQLKVMTSTGSHFGVELWPGRLWNFSRKLTHDEWDTVSQFLDLYIQFQMDPLISDDFQED